MKWQNGNCLYKVHYSLEGSTDSIGTTLTRVATHRAAGGRHSSVDLSESTILRPWVRIYITPSTLFNFKYLSLHCEKDENKQKEVRFSPYTLRAASFTLLYEKRKDTNTLRLRALLIGTLIIRAQIIAEASKPLSLVVVVVVAVVIVGVGVPLKWRNFW